MAKLPVLSELRPWNLRLTPYISKTPIRRNNQRHTVAWVLLLSSNLLVPWSSHLSQCRIILWSSWTVYQWRWSRSSGDRPSHSCYHRPPTFSRAASGPKRFSIEWRRVRDCKDRWQETKEKELWVYFKVCWKKTWILECELGNAQELLRQFEAKHQTQRGGKWGRPARAGKGR